MRKGLLFFSLLYLSQLLFSQSIQINDSTQLINWTFLGGEKRNYYGNFAPSKLNVIWKTYLGKGKTTISRRGGEKLWAGSGWTGQPLLVQEGDSMYVIQATFAHKLKKFNAENGHLVWASDFNDVLKGTGTIWYNPNAKSKESSMVIFQGSRLGYGNYLDSLDVESFKCVSYYTGETLWIHNSIMTSSYSRDVDASCLVINDTLYIGLENSLFTKMSPAETWIDDSIARPKVYSQHLLYNDSDKISHGGNLITEGSISRINNKLYIPSGVGRLWEYDITEDSLTWNFFIGSDIDGSAIVTEDSCILVSVEKQYIMGQGGVFKIKPGIEGAKAVEWYFPTPNTDFAGWKGGIIGSVGINDRVNVYPDQHIAVFSGIDSLMYVIDYMQLDTLSEWVNGPNEKYMYPKPKLLDTYNIGRSISTPLIIGNKIIACGYNGIYLFELTPHLKLKLLDHLEIGEIESTPFVYNGRIYVGSRNGYLYCLGDLE